MKDIVRQNRLLRFFRKDQVQNNAVKRYGREKSTELSFTEEFKKQCFLKNGNRKIFAEYCNETVGSVQRGGGHTMPASSLAF